jgi:hypothetical protein
MGRITKTFILLLEKTSPKLATKLKLKIAIGEAKRKWVSTGKRHYVIPNEKKNGFMVCNNSVMRIMNQQQYRKGRHKLSAIDLANMSVYITPASTLHNI